MNIWNIKEVSIDSVIIALQQGNVIVSPTDTVYGLICDATNKEAVERVFLIKQRDDNKPLPIFIKDIGMAKRLGKIDLRQELFMKRYWPGKITCIVNSREVLPENTGTAEKIGMRIPYYTFLNDVLNKSELPLTGTSANISDIKETSLISEIYSQFKDKKYTPDIIIDAGDLPASLPSSIIDIIDKQPNIIRQGAVSL